MDRRGHQHASARIELKSDIGSADAAPLPARPRRLPMMRHYVGLAGFVCASVVVVAAASWIALSLT